MSGPLGQAAGAGEEAGTPAGVHRRQDQGNAGPPSRGLVGGEPRRDRTDPGQVDDWDDEPEGEVGNGGGRPRQGPAEPGRAGNQAGGVEGGRDGRGQVAEGERLRVAARDDTTPAAITELLLR